MADWHYPSPPSSHASTSSGASSRRLLRAPRLASVSLPTTDQADAFHHAHRATREHRSFPTPVLPAPLDELQDIRPVAPFAPPTVPVALPSIPDDDDVPYVHSPMLRSSAASSGTRSSMSSASSRSSHRSSGPTSPVSLRDAYDTYHMHSRMASSSTGSSGTRSSMSSASSSRSSRRSASPILLHEGLSMALLYDLRSAPDRAQVSSISRSLHISSGYGEAGPSSATSRQGRPSAFPLDDVATSPGAVRVRVEVGPHTVVVDASDGKAVTCRDILGTVHDFLWFHPPHSSLEVTQSTQRAYHRRTAHGRDKLRNIDFLDGRTSCLRFSVGRSRDPGMTLVLDTA